MALTEHRSRMRDMTTAALLAAMIAGTSWITVRLGPVPFTLQTAFVLLAGMLLRPGWAAASVGVYLILGAIGLPVFSGGQAGLSALVGPTGGFLFGFALAAPSLAFVRRAICRDGDGRGRTLESDIVGVLVAELAIYAVGVPWLMFSTGMSAPEAFTVAVLPFLVPDAGKAAVALAIAGAVRRARGAG